MTSIDSIKITFPDASIQWTAGISLGEQQAWVDVTTSRVLSTTYTNSTSKPIFVSAVLSGTDVSLTVGTSARIICRFGTNPDSSSLYQTVYGVIPVGSTYVVNGSSIISWSELR